ncbi:TAXI family TRAP transporter solute-binding subunit [Aestuariirhabdus litorea]|uniref:TAXI family TRAP transporter solute-binding subunit n=1 Tax=Aestuariirhabdus litorea TaxID=2528527 RepID=A0A3P3VLQ5_9GAMM|nr:TAXI family TRAP transporter solute-binding subunit [Aestuariirhabdus litorea]RRJ82808.1 TAXI family TRAP transporter solute-binding subunit [Aestuariirhabdus litorea]RWW92967.1 TAXI family TRAP transporter solute-binding subunit [Endozoicomonadaceae bacterium GTF-13]
MIKIKNTITQLFISAAVLAVLSTPSVGNAKEFVKIATGNVGGTYYPVGVAMGKLFSDKLPNVLSSAMSTGGSVDNIGLLRSQEAQIAILSAKVTHDAYNGADQFESKPFNKLRAITGMWPSLQHVVVSRSIKSFDDLKGKKFVVGAARSGTEVDAHAVLTAANLFYRKEDGAQLNIEPVYVNYGEAVDLMKNEQVAGGLFDAAPPGAAISELLASGDFHILQPSAEHSSKLIEANPLYSNYVVKAGTYPNQENDLTLSGYPAVLVTSTDVSEELAYALTKTLFTSLPRMHKAHKATQFIHPDTAMKGISIEFHPGVVKYFNEQKTASQ